MTFPIQQTVGTHNGEFHADDVFALAALNLMIEGIYLVRSRDPEELAKCDILVDVGGVYDHATRRYDHHQRGGAGVRENGIPYSGFGLIWHHYGIEICDGDKELALEVDRVLVQPIDAHDNGIELWNKDAGCMPYTISHIVKAMNPTWNAPNEYSEAFASAVVLAESVLKDAIRRAGADIAARRVVARAIEEAEDKQVIWLPAFGLHWAWMVGEAIPKEARLVVYPSESEEYLMVQSCAPKQGDFSMLQPLPEEWAGLRGEELARVSGVEDAIFCHPARFVGGAHSLAGAKKMAHLALKK